MQTVAQSPARRNTVAYYAHFHALEGYAVRDFEGRCFFIDHDAQVTELSNADIPHLLLLGNVDLVETQNLLDRLHGNAYEQVDDRNSEHATVAA